MTKYERFKDIPHFDLIVEKGRIEIGSIFMFDNITEFYSFMGACEAFECEVYFVNEDFTVYPKTDTFDSLRLLAYATVMDNRKIGDDYIRYLSNLAKTNWVK